MTPCGGAAAGPAAGALALAMTFGALAFAEALAAVSGCVLGEQACCW
ncbi:MAG TPA: hypothetical protein VLD35_12300 [Caldimonas sp.]|nr:hypothetical protein [Caldimonas sp.]